MRKKTFMAAIIILAFLISLVAGMQAVEVTNAKFFPGDALIINSPYPVVYTGTSVPLDVVASVANPTPAVVYIIYSLERTQT